MATKAKAKTTSAPVSLTLKQQLFVEAYLGKAKGNATEAARIAGYKGNDVTLGAVGAENLKKPQIADSLKLRVEQVKDICSADDVLRELSACASKPWNQLGGIIEPKDKLKALELLGKHHKLFVEKHEVTGNEGAPLFEPFAEAMSKIYGNSEKRTNKTG